jgi:hypothetical protein
VRNSLLFAVLALVLFASVPAAADEARDYIDGEVADWAGIAANNGYNILGTYVGTIGEEEVVYSLQLAPGTYHFYSSGGLHIEDLDLYVYDEEGKELGSDTLPDKIPVVVINLDERTDLTLSATAFSFTEGYSSDYFCVLVTCEEAGEILQFSGEATAVEVPPPTEEEEVSDEARYQEIAQYAEYWQETEEEGGNEVIDYDIVLVKDLTYTLSKDLDAGFYRVFASCDTRCPDLDITVYDEEGEVLADDHAEDNFPICDFGLLEEQHVSIDIEVYQLTEGEDETYVAYLLSFVSGMDKESRREHVSQLLDWILSASEGQNEEVLGSGIEEITEAAGVQEFTFELEAGDYFCEAEGGLETANVDMRVYDEEGNMLGEDTYDDNYPMVWFDLAEPGEITIEVEAVQFAEGFSEGFYCWVLTKLPPGYYDEWGQPGTSWSGDEGELSNTAEVLADHWRASIEDHGEEIIESFTEPVHGEGEENGWEYELELEEGTYYFYAQGDGICLTDLDMRVYGEDGLVADEDILSGNSPVCGAHVGPGGGKLKVNAFAFFLNCDVGYFNLIITRG